MSKVTTTIINVTLTIVWLGIAVFVIGYPPHPAGKSKQLSSFHPLLVVGLCVCVALNIFFIWFRPSSQAAAIASRFVDAGVGGFILGCMLY